jgi:hypothetical protein
VPSCKSCGREIVWALTVNGRRAPIDADSASNGNVRLEDGLATTLGPDAAAAARELGEQLHLNHFVTCPQAAMHARRKKAERG